MGVFTCIRVYIQIKAHEKIEKKNQGCLRVYVFTSKYKKNIKF